MLNIFTEQINIFTESDTAKCLINARVVPAKLEHGNLYMVCEKQSDIEIGDRFGFSGRYWTVISVREVRGTGSIPDYLRVKAKERE